MARRVRECTDARHQHVAAQIESTPAMGEVEKTPSPIRACAAINAPDPDTPKSAPVCRAAFNAPAAIPAWLLSTELIIAVAVSGVTRLAAKPMGGSGSASQA